MDLTYVLVFIFIFSTWASRGSGRAAVGSGGCVGLGGCVRVVWRCLGLCVGVARGFWGCSYLAKSMRPFVCFCPFFKGFLFCYFGETIFNMMTLYIFGPDGVLVPLGFI